MCHIVWSLSAISCTQPKKRYKVFIQNVKTKEISSPMFGSKRKYRRGILYHASTSAPNRFNSFASKLNAKRYVGELSWIFKDNPHIRPVIHEVFVCGEAGKGIIDMTLRTGTQIYATVTLTQHMRVGKRIWPKKTRS